MLGICRESFFGVVFSARVLEVVFAFLEGAVVFTLLRTSKLLPSCVILVSRRQ
jgi:hypothetical protein